MSNFKLVKTAAALALGASVVTSAVATTDASAASKYKIKSGKLVYAKSGKVVKGYVTYKSTVYKNGSKLTGLKGKTYYKAGKKATGTYKGAYYVKGVKKVTTGTYNKAYYVKGVKKVSTGLYASKYYKDGKLATGTYKGAYYVKGLKKVTTGTYNGAYYVKGKKVVSTGLYADKLYVDGKLNKGYKLYKEDLYKDAVLNTELALFEGKLYDGAKLNEGHKIFKDELYNGSELNTKLALFEGKLYNGAKLNEGIQKFEDKWYNNAELADGTFTVEGVEKAFENGVEVGAKVKSVEAINGKQLKVTFNKSVDATTAQDEANYSLDNTALSTANANAVLQEDNKTVILTLNTAYDNESAHSVAVTINNILEKDSTTSKLPKFSTVIKIDDKVAANVTSVEALTNGTTVSEVTVNYSEPVQAGAVIKIDGEKVAVTTAGDTQTITGLSLDSSKEHTVEIVNLKDAAGNINAVVTSKFTAVKDTTAPEVKSVTALNDKQFVVEFSEKIKASTLTTGDFKLVNSSTLANVNVTNVAPLAGDTTGTKYVVTTNLDASNYVTTTTVPLTVAVADKAFTDVAGNEGLASTKSVTLSKDTTAPTVASTKTTLASNGDVASITFTFDKDVQAVAGMDKTKVEVVSKTGLLQDGFVTGVAVSGKTVTLTLKAGVKDGMYSVTLPAGFVTDTSISLNKSAKIDKVFDFGTSETAKEYTITSATNSVGSDNVNTITVNFGTNVVGGAFEGSATNLNAYTLNGKKLSDYAGAQVVLTAQNTAKITLPKGSVAKTDDAAVLQVSGVKSIDGLTNKLYTTVLATALTDNVAPNLQSAQLLADGKTFVLTYDENLKSTSDIAGAFKFTEDAKDVTANLTVKSVTGKTLIVEAQKAVTTPAVKAAADGFYDATGKAYAVKAGDKIGTDYTYFNAGAVIVPESNPGANDAKTATTAGFYDATGAAYTVKSGDAIGANKYYAKDAEIVAPVTNNVNFDLTKAVTIETVAAADKVEDAAGNDQKAEIKVTTTR